MNTKNFFSLLLVAILAIGLGVGCSKKSNPVAPQTVEPTPTNPGDGEFTPPAGWTVVFTGVDYVITGKNAGTHYEYEHLVKTSSIPANWQDCYLFGSADAWQVQPMTSDGVWYRIRKSYTGLQKFNFCGGTQGGKWPGDTLMKHWAQTLYFWDNRAQQTATNYGGDLIAVFNGLSVRPATQTDLDVWYNSNTGGTLTIGVQVIQDGLGKVSGNDLYIDTNLSGEQKSYKIGETFTGLVMNGANIAVGDGNRRVRFRVIVNGVTQPEFKYDVTVPERSVAQYVNLRTNGTVDQDNSPSGGQSLQQFTISGLSKFQDSETGWDVKRKLYFEPAGSEWMSVGTSRVLNVPRVTTDGKHEYVLGVFRSELQTGTIKSPTGQVIGLNMLTVLDWYAPETARVLFEFDPATGVIKAPETISKTVRIYENVNHSYLMQGWFNNWSGSEQGWTRYQAGQYQEVTLTVSVCGDTSWYKFGVLNDGGLQKVYAECGVQKIHLQQFDEWPGYKDGSWAWVGLAPTGNIVTRGKYPVSYIIGGNP